MLEGVVARLSEREPAWADRLDVVFVGAPTLAHVRAGGPLVSVSHDEPLARFDDADDWLQTWFLVREADAALVGPPIATIIPEIPVGDFVAAVARHTVSLVDVLDATTSDGRLAYLVLTLARVVAALEGERVVSKAAAGLRLVARRPELEPAITASLAVHGTSARTPFRPDDRRAAIAVARMLAREIADGIMRP